MVFSLVRGISLMQLHIKLCWIVSLYPRDHVAVAMVPPTPYRDEGVFGYRAIALTKAVFHSNFEHGEIPVCKINLDVQTRGITIWDVKDTFFARHADPMMVLASVVFEVTRQASFPIQLLEQITRVGLIDAQLEARITALRHAVGDHRLPRSEYLELGPGAGGKLRRLWDYFILLQSTWMSQGVAGLSEENRWDLINMKRMALPLSKLKEYVISSAFARFVQQILLAAGKPMELVRFGIGELYHGGPASHAHSRGWTTYNITALLNGQARQATDEALEAGGEPSSIWARPSAKRQGPSSVNEGGGKRLKVEDDGGDGGDDRSGMRPPTGKHDDRGKGPVVGDRT